MARRPARPGGKLLIIRKALGLSQNGILRPLGLADELTQAEWSAYERGVRITSLPVLLMTAELAGVWRDVLVNGDLDLPDEIPASPKSAGLKSNPRLTVKSSSQTASKRNR
jgi:transcriptional regulator with XRE-family HTH domain